MAIETVDRPDVECLRPGLQRKRLLPFHPAEAGGRHPALRRTLPADHLQALDPRRQLRRRAVDARGSRAVEAGDGGVAPRHRRQGTRCLERRDIEVADLRALAVGPLGEKREPRPGSAGSVEIAGIEGPPAGGEVDQGHRLVSIAPQEQRFDADGAPGGILPRLVRLDHLEAVARLPGDDLCLPFGKLSGQLLLPDWRQRLDSCFLLFGKRDLSRRHRHRGAQELRQTLGHGEDDEQDRKEATGGDHREGLLDRGGQGTIVACGVPLECSRPGARRWRGRGGRGKRRERLRAGRRFPPLPSVAPSPGFRVSRGSLVCRRPLAELPPIECRRAGLEGG